MSETTTETPSEVTKVARDLREIEDMSALLLTQAVHKANDSEIPGGAAMVALAGVANQEAWGNLVDTALRLAYDAGSDLPEIEDEEDWEPPLQTLCFWTEQLRAEHGNEYDMRPTVVSEINYLRYMLNWLWENETHWDDFARDIRKARVRLENTLYAGRRVERTRVPCNADECETKPRLIKTRGEAVDGSQDRHKCPGCKKRYDEDDFARAYAAQLRSKGAERFVQIRDAIGTLRALGRSENTIRSWLAPYEKHVANSCADCDLTWERGTDECPECEKPTEKVVERRPEDVVHAYCETGTHRVWVWWPDLWLLHVNTATRRRVA